MRFLIHTLLAESDDSKGSKFRADIRIKDTREIESDHYHTLNEPEIKIEPLHQPYTKGDGVVIRSDSNNSLPLDSITVKNQNSSGMQVTTQKIYNQPLKEDESHKPNGKA